MNTKTVVVHCEYSEDGKDIADIIQESFYKRNSAHLP